MLVSLFRLFAVFALCFHMATPSLAAIVAKSGLDVSRFICVTPGVELTEIQLGMATRLAEAFSVENDVPNSSEEPCSFCVLANAAILPARAEPARLPLIFSAPPAIRFEAGFVSDPRGPPVGSTGPPMLHLI